MIRRNKSKITLKILRIAARFAKKFLEKNKDFKDMKFYLSESVNLTEDG